MLQFFWPPIRHDPKLLPTEMDQKSGVANFVFFEKNSFLILEVLTLRLFWGIRSLNFKTFKTLVLDQVLKVLTLSVPSCK